MFGLIQVAQDAVAGGFTPESAANYLSLLGAGIGAGLTVIGAGIARQPEAAASVQTTSIILAALIEGVALFSLVIMLLFKLL